MAVDDITEKEYERMQAARQGAGESKLEKESKKGTDTKKSFFRTLGKFNLFDWGLIGATSVASLLTGGLFNWVSVTGTYLLSHAITQRGNYTKKGVKSEFYLGGVMTITLDKMYRYLSGLNPVHRTVIGLGVLIPIFNAIYLPVQHIFRKYTPLGFARNIFRIPKEVYHKSIKPNYFRSLKAIYTFMTLPFIYVWNFVPLMWQIPATSATRFGYKTILDLAQKKKGYAPKGSYAPSYKPE